MANKLKSKKPQQGNKISVKGAGLSTNHLKPNFSLEHLQKNYCVSNCTQEEKAAFVDSLFKRSEMTWNEIMQASRHGLGQETIPQRSINAPLLEDITPETKLIALRFKGMAPMVGRRDGQKFIIYWLDLNLDYIITISFRFRSLPFIFNCSTSVPRKFCERWVGM